MPSIDRNMPETEYEVDTHTTTIFRKPKGHRLNPGDAKKSIYTAGTDEPNADADGGRSWTGQV